MLLIMAIKTCIRYIAQERKQHHTGLKKKNKNSSSDLDKTHSLKYTEWHQKWAAEWKEKPFWLKAKQAIIQRGVLLWIPTVLCNPIFVNRRWQAGPPFSSPDCSRLGVFPHFPPGCALPAGQLVLAHRSLKAQPRVWGGLLSVSGVQDWEKHSPFCLCGHCVSAEHTSHCVLDSLPTSILPEDVIKDGQEKRAKSELTRRSGCLVWAESPEISAESWPSTEQHKTSPVPFSCSVAMADPNNIPGFSLLQLPNHLHRPPAWAGPGPHSLLIGI